MGKVRRISNITRQGEPPHIPKATKTAIFAIPLCLFGVNLSASLISPSASAAEKTSIKDDISLAIGTVCSFASEGNASKEDMTFTGSGANGFEVEFNNSGIHNFNVACNQLTGYTVKAWASPLENSEGAIDFVDPNDYGTRKSNSPNTGIWTAVLTGGDSGALLGTSESTAQTIKSNTGISAVEGDIFSVQYKAYIGKATLAGTYTGNAYYTLTMNPLFVTTYDYMVSYHANGIAGTPATQYGERELNQDVTITLSNQTPTPAGDIFLGWDTSPTAATVVYSPGQEIILTSGRPHLNLYAVWQTGPTFQAFTTDQCDNLQEHETISLKDYRDGKRYLVSKMKDDNCWMTQNLALEPGTVIYKEDSNITANHYIIPSPTEFSGRELDAQATILPKAHQDATANDVANNPGGYYTWNAATAGTGPSTAEGVDAPSSICPKGWRLPTGGSLSELDNLYTLYGSYASFVGSPWGGAAIGMYTGGNLSLTEKSLWWSSTRYPDAEKAFFLDYNVLESAVYSRSNTQRDGGFSVRCIFSAPAA